MSEAKKILEKREKEDELGYEQKLASEHLKKFTRLKYNKAKDLMKELNSVTTMSAETVTQIVNQLPKNPDELRLIFTKERFNLKEEELKKILTIVKKYI